MTHKPPRAGAPAPGLAPGPDLIGQRARAGPDTWPARTPPPNDPVQEWMVRKQEVSWRDIVIYGMSDGHRFRRLVGLMATPVMSVALVVAAIFFAIHDVGLERAHWIWVAGSGAAVSAVAGIRSLWRRFKRLPGRRASTPDANPEPAGRPDPRQAGPGGAPSDSATTTARQGGTNRRKGGKKPPDTND